MKNSIVFIVLVVSTIGLSLVLPWWCIGPLAFLLAFFAKLHPATGFFLSLLGGFTAWFFSIYYLDAILVQRILGDLFEVGASLIPAISSLLGGLVAGLFGWAGALLSKPKRKWANG